MTAPRGRDPLADGDGPGGEVPHGAKCPAPSRPAAGGDGPAPPPVVILAEDDDELRRLITTKLARRGCVVLEARNGMELAQLVIERGVEPPPGARTAAEVVITDIRMPGVTGLEIAGLLRQLDWVLPLILITGFGDRATHAEAARLGVRIFDKPVDLDVLVDAACACLGL